MGGSYAKSLSSLKDGVKPTPSPEKGDLKR